MSDSERWGGISYARSLGGVSLFDLSGFDADSYYKKFGYKSGTLCEGTGQLNENTGGKLAERVGFEPTVGFPLHSLSRRALSTAQTPLRSVWP